MCNVANRTVLGQVLQSYMRWCEAVPDRSALAPTHNLSISVKLIECGLWGPSADSSHGSNRQAKRHGVNARPDPTIQ